MVGDGVSETGGCSERVVVGELVLVVVIVVEVAVAVVVGTPMVPLG